MLGTKPPVILQFLHVSDERWHHRLRHQILSEVLSNHRFCFRSGEMIECTMVLPTLSLFNELRKNFLQSDRGAH
jgi:hypothetical protein